MVVKGPEEIEAHKNFAYPRAQMFWMHSISRPCCHLILGCQREFPSIMTKLITHKIRLCKQVIQLWTPGTACECHSHFGWESSLYGGCIALILEHSLGAQSVLVKSITVKVECRALKSSSSPVLAPPLRLSFLSSPIQRPFMTGLFPAKMCRNQVWNWCFSWQANISHYHEASVLYIPKSICIYICYHLNCEKQVEHVLGSI